MFLVKISTRVSKYCMQNKTHLVITYTICEFISQQIQLYGEKGIIYLQSRNLIDAIIQNSIPCIRWFVTLNLLLLFPYILLLLTCLYIWYMLIVRVVVIKYNMQMKLLRSYPVTLMKYGWTAHKHLLWLHY